MAKKIKRSRSRRKRRVRNIGKYRSTKMNVEMTFRSNWEKFYFAYLDNNPDVIAFWSELLRIPYLSNKKTGKLRNYIPDLLIEYADKKCLVEIKPKSRVHQVKNIKKFHAAMEYCKIQGWEFVIVTELELKKLGLL